MSGECERCGEHVVDCSCKSKQKTDIRKLKLQIARRAYKEIIAAIKHLEEHFLCSIQWDEFVSVDGEGFGFFDLTSKE